MKAENGMRSDLRRTFFGIVLFVLLSLPFWATGEGPTGTKLVAVLDLRNDADLPQRDMDYLTEVVRTGARQALPLGAFKLMTKENITELLPPDKKNLANCEGECEVETGRLLGANYLVTGTVTKFSGELRVTIRLYDVAGGDMLDSKKASAQKVLELEKPIEEIASSIFIVIPGARNPNASREVQQQTFYSEEDSFQTAFLEYRKQHFDGARKLFGDFMKQYPQSPKVGDAQFFIGEILFIQKGYTDAILAYDELTSKFPKNSHVPQAVLNQAIAFEQLGQKFDAKLFFEKVISEYPNSEEAKIAKKKLSLMKK